jgi:hypothetical protein
MMDKLEYHQMLMDLVWDAVNLTESGELDDAEWCIKKIDEVLSKALGVTRDTPALDTP